ncbi:MAG: thioredoxin [Candidatus Riflebacteria bacterium]|nr:thioredoxin [Candidatus Riflebacteria bacterium]
MTTPVHATFHDFDDQVLKSEVPVLVDFFADWCGPCRALAPILETLAPEFEGRVKIVKVDCDEELELGSRYQIRSIPTLLLFQGGVVVDTLVGSQPLDVLRKRLTRAAQAVEPRVGVA